MGHGEFVVDLRAASFAGMQDALLTKMRVSRDNGATADPGWLPLASPLLRL